MLAYIDGATGSMALQIIIAGSLSAVYAISTKWALLKSRFTKKPVAQKPK